MACMCSTISRASDGQSGSLIGSWNLLAESWLTSLVVPAGMNGTSSGAPLQHGSTRGVRIGKWGFWGRDRSFIASSNLALEVTQLHFHYSQWQAHHNVTSPLKFKGKDGRLSWSWESFKTLVFPYLCIAHTVLQAVCPKTVGYQVTDFEMCVTLVCTPASLPTVLGRGRRKAIRTQREMQW